MMEYYTALILFAVFTMLVLIALAAKNDALSRRMRIGVVGSALMIILAALCEYLGTAMSGGPAELRIPHMVVKFLELSLAPAIPVLYANAIQPVKPARLLVIPLAAHALLEFLSMWLGLTFYVDAANVYYHCSLYYIYYAAYFAGIVFLIVQVARFTRRFQSRNKLGLTLIMCFVLLGIVWQAADSSMKVVWLAVAIGNVLFYIYYCDILQQIDTLTQLLNRRSYENHIRLPRGRTVILMADIDNFKSVNDSFGHPFGDACLTEIGAALKQAYGKHGLCYRIGGDEFCVVLYRQLDAVESMNSAFFKLLDAKRGAIPELPHVSVGYAEFDPDSMTADEAAAKADQMMYVFKQRVKRMAIQD